MRTGLTQIDPTEAAVLDAFDDAKRAGRPAVECYRAGVAAWRRLHPEHAPEAAAKKAVAVILATYQDDMLRVE